MKRTQGKSARIEQVKLMLLASREFVSKAEIARRCKVNRSTITRMLDEFPDMSISLDYDEKGRVRIDRTKYLVDLKLNLDEALAVFIAGRLLARHSDRPNPHVINALAKLGIALKGPVRVIGDHVLTTSEQLRRKSNQATREYVRALETLTRAWADRVSVYLYHRKEPQQSRKFDPYFIEPSMFTTYVIGFDHLRQDIRTFKVQWLKSISLTSDFFSIPKDFDPYRYLGNAWGINWGTGKLVEVRLRFTGNAAERVADNVWHESQQLERCSDGSRILIVKVGSTLEMTPWIRQWGSECQVLEPAELRTWVAEEARKMAKVYETEGANS
jgi:proteasome accessory factor B